MNTTRSDTDSPVDVSEYLTANRYSVDDYSDADAEREEMRHTHQRETAQSSTTIAALLDELESIQSTYVRLTKAFGASEKENTTLVSTLQQITEERQQLLQRIARRSASRERSRSTAEGEIVLLKERIALLEEENWRLRRVEQNTNGPSAADRSPPVHAPPLFNAQSEERGPSTTGVSLDASPSSPLTLRETASTMEAAAAAATPPQPSSSWTLEYEVMYTAMQEKLWMVIHCRNRQLERVSKLLASAENRNVELSHLLENLCQNISKQQQRDESQMAAAGGGADEAAKEDAQHHRSKVVPSTTLHEEASSSPPAAEFVRPYVPPLGMKTSNGVVTSAAVRPAAYQAAAAAPTLQKPLPNRRVTPSTALVPVAVPVAAIQPRGSRVPPPPPQLPSHSSASGPSSVVASASLHYDPHQIARVGSANQMGIRRPSVVGKIIVEKPKFKY